MRWPDDPALALRSVNAPKRLDAFARLMNEKLENADTNTPQGLYPLDHRCD
jgi:hypothetical protein